MRHFLNIFCFFLVTAFIALAVWYKSMIWGVCAVITCAIWMFFFPDSDSGDDNDDVYSHPNRLAP